MKDLESQDVLRVLTGKYHDLILFCFQKKINLATVCKMNLEERAWGQKGGTL